MPSHASELRKFGLCKEADFNKKTYECSRLITAEKDTVTTIKLSDREKLYCITELHASVEEEILHVWFHRGDDNENDKATFYDERQRSYLGDTELLWLASQEGFNLAEDAVSVVKLYIEPSENFRTRSSKKLWPHSIGAWRIEVYSLSPTPDILGILRFRIER